MVVALEIRPLHLGTLTVDKSGLTLRKGLGSKVQAPCFGWLVLGGAEPVLVDTGPSDDPAWGARFHNPLLRDPSQSMERQLARHGVSPNSIRHVVLTHLHWDHCYGNACFPNATFYVQKAEYDYALAPFPCDAPIYEAGFERPPYRVGEERYRLVDGEADPFDGIRLIGLPGHSPGLQGVLVATGGGPTLIGSDHFPLFENFEENIPTGIIHSLADWYRATQRVRALGARVLPGHDMRVMDRDRY